MESVHEERMRAFVARNRQYSSSSFCFSALHLCGLPPTHSTLSHNPLGRCWSSSASTLHPFPSYFSRLVQEWVISSKLILSLMIGSSTYSSVSYWPGDKEANFPWCSWRIVVALNYHLLCVLVCVCVCVRAC